MIGRFLTRKMVVEDDVLMLETPTTTATCDNTAGAGGIDT